MKWRDEYCQEAQRDIRILEAQIKAQRDVIEALRARLATNCPGFPDGSDGPAVTMEEARAALDRVFMMAAQGEPMLGTLVDRLLRDRIALGELVEDARPHMEDMRLWPSSGPDSARGDR